MVVVNFDRNVVVPNGSPRYSSALFYTMEMNVKADLVIFLSIVRLHPGQYYQ